MFDAAVTASLCSEIDSPSVFSVLYEQKYPVKVDLPALIFLKYHPAALKFNVRVYLCIVSACSVEAYELCVHSKHKVYVLLVALITLYAVSVSAYVLY